MYWARLVDVLREDFPRVAVCLGAERFTGTALRYWARHRGSTVARFRSEWRKL